MPPVSGPAPGPLTPPAFQFPRIPPLSSNPSQQEMIYHIYLIDQFISHVQAFQNPDRPLEPFPLPAPLPIRPSPYLEPDLRPIPKGPGLGGPVPG